MAVAAITWPLPVCHLCVKCPEHVSACVCQSIIHTALLLAALSVHSLAAIQIHLLSVRLSLSSPLLARLSLIAYFYTPYLARKMLVISASSSMKVWIVCKYFRLSINTFLALLALTGTWCVCLAVDKRCSKGWLVKGF